MTTILAAVQARHQQAIATLDAAEAELLACMASIDPRPTLPIVDGQMPRRFEALLEGPRPYWELAQAYGTYRRAQRTEAKARSAAHRAKFAAVPAAPPASPAPRRRKAKKKVSVAAYVRERLAEEAEARAA